MQTQVSVTKIRLCLHCACISHFLYLYDNHLGWFYDLVLKNSTEISMDGYISLWCIAPEYLERMSRSVIAGSHCSTTFSLVRNSILTLVLHCPSSIEEFPLSSPLPAFAIFLILMVRHYVQGKTDFQCGFNWHFLANKVVEQVLKCGLSCEQQPFH